MKLWLLRPITQELWEPWHSKAFGFVVRAETEEKAREVATAFAGEELTFRSGEAWSPWSHPEHSSCVELLPEGEVGLVLRDYAAA